MNRPRDALAGQESPRENIDLSSPTHDPSLITSSSSPFVEPDETKWFRHEIERYKDLSEQIAHIQLELRDLRSILAQRYRPSVEAQVQRLSIERDETLISWGQSLLGLCEGGAQLKLHSTSGEQIALYPTIDPTIPPPTEYVNSHQSHAESSEISVIESDRLLGQREGSLEHHTSPSYQSLESMYTDEVTNISDHEIKSGSEIGPNEAEASLLEDDSQPLEPEDDPGIADAQTVSLTQFSLNELRQQMLSPKGWSSPDDTSDASTSEDGEVELAIEISKRLGRPRLFSPTQLKEHLIELESEVECCQRWSGFEQSVQHAVVTLVTSRLRAIQDHIGESPFDQDRIAKMFRRLTRFSSDFRPGFIHGLSREKVPEFDTWRNDEIKAWQRLEELLNIKPPLPSLSPERAEKLDHIRSLLRHEKETPDFSNVLRAAVTDCLNSGFNQESPHLIKVLESHLSYLSGKRFKKLRLAANMPRI